MDAQDKTRHSPRLYVEGDLAAGREAAVSDAQAHYLRHVLRVQSGDPLRLFNGRDGEWLARTGAVTKRAVEIVAEKNLRTQKTGVDLWLCAAPIKKAHFEYMIEKATELGVAALRPMLTERTQIREVNTERARGIAIEAAEQSDRLDIPEIHASVTFGELVAHWPADRVPVICAEWGEEAIPAHEALAAPTVCAAGKAAIITGPEGGFAAAELEALRSLENAVFIRLGPRILRADTAAIAALSLWQALCGDWSG